MEKQDSTAIWVNEKRVAAITGFALSTLRNDRSLSRGIPYSKRYGRVRYRVSDVEAFMEDGLIDVTAPGEENES
jgi:hypothetical protein